MEIDPKYRIEEFPLTLRVIEAFDFREEPILLLEKDTIGNTFLSYLVRSNEESELRAYLQVSNERLSAIAEKDISLSKAFASPENNHIYMAEFALSNAEVLSSYLIPSNVFSLVNPIPEDYDVDIAYAANPVTLDDAELVTYSEQKQKIVLDFYLQSQNLVFSIKPYAFFKVFTPTVEIIKRLLSFDGRNADRYLAFSNLRQSSLGVTIELNYSRDLFLQKEAEVMETLMLLLNAQTKEDFEKIISRTKNEKYIEEYTKIITAIIDNNANLHTAYANPITKEVITSILDKDKAQKAKLIIDERFDVIEDVEEITGTFLEIDLDTKEPGFKIHIHEEPHATIKGKFDLSMIEKVKNDFVNIGKETYKFTIKTYYYPETTLKAEEIKRFMINYEKK